MKNIHFVFLFTLVLFCACKKEEAPLPPPPPPPVEKDTLPELDSIYLLRNGKAYIFKDVIKVSSWEGKKIKYFWDNWQIKAGIYEHFRIHDIPIKKGVYALENFDYNNYDNNVPSFGIEWILDGDQVIGGLGTDTLRKENFMEIIRYDSINNVLEGRFEAHLKNYGGHLQYSLPDRLSFTKGKFRLKIVE